MEAPSYRALIFDLDGVIIDSEPLHEKAKKVTFDRYGLQVAEHEYRAFQGKPDRDMIEHVVRVCADGLLDVDEVIAIKQSVYRDLVHELKPVPGAISFIQRAARHYTLALTTSAVPANQQIPFDMFGLHSYFKLVVTADDISRPKPDPEPYEVTLRKLGMKGENCLVIEDSVNGVLSAAGAGCFVAGLTTSFAPGELREAGAHFTVDSFRELAQQVLPV